MNKFDMLETIEGGKEDCSTESCQPREYMFIIMTFYQNFKNVFF